MKKLTVYTFSAFLLITVISCEKKSVGSPELTLFSDTVDWGWELGEFYGGNSFYWWHNTDQGVLNLGDMPTDCWTRPYDFEYGHYYLRFEIFPMKARITVIAVADGHNFSGWENHP